MEGKTNLTKIPKKQSLIFQTWILTILGEDFSSN